MEGFVLARGDVPVRHALRLPQFSATHINFQRIPLTDTSNPFQCTSVPTADQSQVMIHFLKPKPSVDYTLKLKGLIDGTMITGFNTLAIPGGKMMYAMELMKGRGQLVDYETCERVRRALGRAEDLGPRNSGRVALGPSYHDTLRMWSQSP
jgi:hypothetical protein